MKLLIEQLRENLPAWHFQPYGQDGAVACYPPHGPCADAFNALHRFAPISSVCGVLYVVTALRPPLLNPLSIYYETGAKAAVARRRHDEALASFHRDWLSRARDLEDKFNRRLVEEEFNRGYREAGDHTPIPFG